MRANLLLALSNNQRAAISSPARGAPSKGDDCLDRIIRKPPLHIRYSVFKNESYGIAQTLLCLFNCLSLAVRTRHLRTDRPTPPSGASSMIAVNSPFMPKVYLVQSFRSMIVGCPFIIGRSLQCLSRPAGIANKSLLGSKIQLIKTLRTTLRNVCKPRFTLLERNLPLDWRGEGLRPCRILRNFNSD